MAVRTDSIMLTGS